MAFLPSGGLISWGLCYKVRNKFLLIEIDYFKKWVEVEVLAMITKAKIQNFVWKNTVCRFRIPKMIILENGR